MDDRTPPTDEPPRPATHPRRPGGTAPAHRTRAILALLLGWTFLAWIWISRPTFIFGEPDGLRSSEGREASLRFGLYLQRQALDGYAEANDGRLPASLDELGPSDAVITWERSGDGYTLVGADGELTLLLTDRMDADSFLGDALRLLQTAR